MRQLTADPTDCQAVDWLSALWSARTSRKAPIGLVEHVGPNRPTPRSARWEGLVDRGTPKIDDIDNGSKRRIDSMSYTQTITLGGLFDAGLTTRRDVLGAAYVDKSIDAANDFMMAFQHITTEWCWGYAWNRPGLDKKTRSMLNLAMLTALNRAPEIKLHTRGAINNGVTVDEIKEVLLHATVYCGIPAGLDAFKSANEVLKEMGQVK
jgi:4-carboxymuconolactone decarboxylase